MIANGENAAGGSGITLKTAEEIFAAGVDIITSGDHLWDQKEVMELLERERRFVRPLNYPPGTPGQGSTVFQAAGPAAGGRAEPAGTHFMAALENPFHAALAEVERLRQHDQHHLRRLPCGGDLGEDRAGADARRPGERRGGHAHARADGRRADFPRRHGVSCDAGFTGPHESVIGREIEPIIQRFMTNMPQRFEVAKERVLLQGAVVEIDEQSGRALGIERVSETVQLDAFRWPSQLNRSGTSASCSRRNRPARCCPSPS